MSKTSQAVSLSVHAGLIALLLLIAAHPAIIPMPPAATRLLYRPPAPFSGRAGGGGMHETAPARKGVLPPRSTRVFMPPMQRVNFQPRLAVLVVIDAPPDTPADTSLLFGDPHGIGAVSAGIGGPAGIGDNLGRSIGSSTGDRYGPGADVVFNTGHGVTLPIPIHTTEPEYAEPARRARVSGSVLVYAEIGPDGKPGRLRVLKGLGLGLDEKALEAVAKWLFRPGMKDGRPVAVRATFEVNFRLL